MSSKDGKDVALKYLYYREHSTYEVKEHLKTKGFSEEEIFEAIEFLIEYNYVNDENFCNNFINYGISKGKGSIRLYYELNEKGIPNDIIQRVIEENFDTEKEKENAYLQACKIIGSSSNKKTLENTLEKDKLFDEKLFAKVGRRLSSLGYSTNIVYYVLERIKSIK